MTMPKTDKMLEAQIAEKVKNEEVTYNDTEVAAN
jgi:hypothetical protein